MWGVCAGVRRACDAEQEVASGLGWARLGGVCSAERWSTSCCLSESSEHRREKPQQQNVAQSSTQTSISNSFSINTHSGADSGAGGWRGQFIHPWTITRPAACRTRGGVYPRTGSRYPRRRADFPREPKHRAWLDGGLSHRTPTSGAQGC